MAGAQNGWYVQWVRMRFVVFDCVVIAWWWELLGCYNFSQCLSGKGWLRSLKLRVGYFHLALYVIPVSVTITNFQGHRRKMMERHFSGLNVSWPRACCFWFCMARYLSFLCLVLAIMVSFFLCLFFLLFNSWVISIFLSFFSFFYIQIITNISSDKIDSSLGY